MESTTWKDLVGEAEAKAEAKGLAEGLAKGEAKGEAKGALKVLTLLLERRLGERARAFASRLQAASPAELESVAELLADQGTKDDLVGALEALLPRTDPRE